MCLHSVAHYYPNGLFIKKTDVKVKRLARWYVVGHNECLINASKNLHFAFVMNYGSEMLSHGCGSPRSLVSSVDLAVDNDH